MKKLPVFAIIVSTVFLFIFSWSTSPLYLTYGGDSPFFQTIGLGILQGKVPYVDLFDHKGPVPFFMDAFGYATGLGRIGIFLLQVVNMSITIFLLIKLAYRFTLSYKQAMIAVLLSLIPLADFITEGNQVEEWQLPYIALTLYLVASYLLDREKRPDFPPALGFILGLCCGMVFFNRPNDGVMWTGSLFLGLCILWCSGKEWKTLLKNIPSYIGGVIFSAVPFFVYFGVHGAIPDWYYGMITHNIRYATDVPFTWGGIGMILIPVIIVGASGYMFAMKGRKDFFFVLAPMLIFTVALIGKRDYYHYLIPITPFITMCFAQCLEMARKAFLWIVCSLFVIFSFAELRFMVRAFFLRPTLKEFYAQSDALFDYVPEDERNMVWNDNLIVYPGDEWPHLVSMMACFVHKGLTPSSPILAAYDLYYLEDTHGLQARKPKWVIMCPEEVYTRDFEYLEENYELIATTPSEPVCELRLYRRIQLGEDQ